VPLYIWISIKFELNQDVRGVSAVMIGFAHDIAAWTVLLCSRDVVLTPIKATMKDSLFSPSMCGNILFKSCSPK
jgi:hypothetical protein